MVQPGRRDSPVAGHAGHGFVKRASLAQRAGGHARPGEPVQLVVRYLPRKPKPTKPKTKKKKNPKIPYSYDGLYISTPSRLCTVTLFNYRRRRQSGSEEAIRKQIISSCYVYRGCILRSCTGCGKKKKKYLIKLKTKQKLTNRSVGRTKSIGVKSTGIFDRKKKKKLKNLCSHLYSYL